MFSKRTHKIVQAARAIQSDSESTESECYSDDSVRDKNFIPSDSSDDNTESDQDEINSKDEVNPVENENDWAEQTKEWARATSSNILMFEISNNVDKYIFPEGAITPLDFYKLFVTDEIVDIIVEETNKFASQIIQTSKFTKGSRMKTWKPTTANEILSLFSVIFAMGLVHLPEINLYWSKDLLYSNTFVSKIMPRDRFLLLLKCLHFADNLEDTKEDKLFKIRPILEPMLKSFKTYLQPGENIVIDESVIPWRGRLSFRQYIKNKTHPYGIKLYKLCTVGGYVLNLRMYTGKGTDITAGKGHAQAVVTTLMQNYVNSGHTLYCDNYYTSIDLARYLLAKNTRICGTVRSNRKGLPENVVKKKLRKGEVIGEQKDNIKVIKWLDKRPVLMLSTKEDHDDLLVETGKTRKNEPIKKPKCVNDYNAAKKGVDYSDQMGSYYNVLRKTKKWYRKVVFSLIFDSCVINAWKLYNYKAENKMSMLNFRDALCKALLVNVPPRPRTPKRIHTLTEGGPDTKKRRKCKGCYQILRKSMSSREADNKVKKVFTYCAECDGTPYYCLTCFNEVHEKKVENV